MHRETITSAGVELDVFEDGAGSPILFLHSAQGFAPEHPYVVPLSARHRLIAPSHPGFGKSGMADWIDAVGRHRLHLSGVARPTDLDVRSM